MPNTPKDMRSFVQEVRVLLSEEQDHRRREEDLRSCGQMLEHKGKPPAEQVKQLAEAVR